MNLHNKNNRPPSATAMRSLVATALAEDLNRKSLKADITASLLGEDSIVEARVRLNEKAVLCGCSWFAECFRQLAEYPGPLKKQGNRIMMHWLKKEGEHLTPGDVCRLSGRAKLLLAGERTALNLLQTLSGTATRAAYYANLAKSCGYRGKILDTRKTVPGLRDAQKYAVRIGGCDNHRMGLYDAILIKENHILAAQSVQSDVESLIRRARLASPGRELILETENLAEVRAGLRYLGTYPAEGGDGRDVILLDNFSAKDLQDAIALRNLTNRNVCLEVSGIKNESELTDVMQLQPDRISLGRLTKDVIATDFSVRFSRFS